MKIKHIIKRLSTSIVESLTLHFILYLLGVHNPYFEFFIHIIELIRFIYDIGKSSS